jgi:hypothetical protein
MGHLFISLAHLVAIVLLCLASHQFASAQFAPSVAPSKPNGASSGAQKAVGSGHQSAVGAGQQAAPSNFYYAPTYYGTGGGYDSIATPWSSQYGGWIVQPTSYWGQDDISRQQARMQGKMQYQDLQLRALQLRQAAFNERLYEKMSRQSPESLRDESREQQLTRARNTPPRDEIVSGAALNVLLDSIQRTRAQDPFPGPSIPLDPETARHLNLTTAESGTASNGTFTPGNLPAWPGAFASPFFDFDKRRIEANLRTLAKPQLFTRVDESRVADSKRIVARLREALFQLRANVPVNDYAAALEFLTKLSNTIAALANPNRKGTPDATGAAAKANTVGVLADFMIANGLKFAIATKGFESYYETLYQQLVKYELGLARLTGQQSPP